MATNKRTAVGTGLVLGALGVVFGDIGTSPLYALKTAFSLPHMREYATDTVVVHGLLSLLIWTVTLIVSVKYIGMVMKANNHGEGGIMALVSIISSSRLRKRWIYVALGLAGVALFYGDSVVTPAISVLSAAEGLGVISPGLDHLVVPVTIALLVLLFGVQRYGTELIGRLFGPVMVLWFAVMAVGGLWRIVQHPAILQALSPAEAVFFAIHHPLMAFLSMSAVVLAVTGAEALYADMGHFGRPPIARAWFLCVFPALVLCYLGQGALVLYGGNPVSNPFFELFPAVVRPAILVLATAATLIASQSVISGAFSLTRQAIQLGFVPRMRIVQTSDHSFGQIYIPLVNGLLLVGVLGLVLAFGSSERLAGAFGLAVSGTLLVDSILLMIAMRPVWKRSLPKAALYCGGFIILEAILLLANLPKIPHGGWVPLTLAALLLLCFNAWIRGQRIISRERRALEPPLDKFIAKLQDKRRKPLVRLPGHAIYIGHHPGKTPTALRTAIEDMHELPEKTVIVYVTTSSAAHVPVEDRVAIDSLGYADGISQVTITYGFHDTPNIPRSLESVRYRSPELNFDPYKAHYFISLSRVVPGGNHAIHGWQRAIYTAMSRNSLSSSDYYHLPADRTLEVRTLLPI